MGAMRHLVWVGVLALAACGHVADDPGGEDAAPPGGDGSNNSCPDPTSVTSCGAACVACPGGGEREVPTCDGTQCGLGCFANAPRCNDDSCSRLGWDFTSNMLDGATPRAPAGLVLAVRNHNGNLALAIDVADLQATQEVSFVVPICVTGTIDIVSKNLTATIFFDDPSLGTTGGEQFFFQASVPDPKNGAFLKQFGVAANASFQYVAPLSLSQFSNTATSVTFQAGTFGGPFHGTIWFDDIAIE